MEILVITLIITFHIQAHINRTIWSQMDEPIFLRKNKKTLSAGLLLRILSKVYGFTSVFYNRKSLHHIDSLGFYQYISTEKKKAIGITGTLYRDTSTMGLGVVSHEFGHFLVHKTPYWSFLVYNVYKITKEYMWFIVVVLWGKTFTQLEWISTPTILLYLALVTILFIDEILASVLGMIVLCKIFTVNWKILLDASLFYLRGFLTYFNWYALVFAAMWFIQRNYTF